MRLALVALGAALIIGMSALASPVAASSTHGDLDGEGGVQQLLQQRGVDDNDDTRVAVQLVVLAVAGGVVIVLGTGAYLLRRRLGLTRYDPSEHTATSHH